MRNKGQPPPPPQSPCVWTGTGSGYRSLEHRDGCLCRLGHPPAHPFASSEPYWAQEDIKTARSNIALWGIGGVAEGSAPQPPPAGRPRSRHLRLADAVRSAWLPAGRGAGGGGYRPRHSASPPGAAHGSGPMGPAPLDDGGAAAPPLPGRVPGRDPRVGPRPDHAGSTPGRVEAPLPRGGSMMCGVGELHGPRGPPRAAAALAAHSNVQRVIALVHVQGGSKAAPTVAALLQTLRRSRASLAVPGAALQGVVRT